MSADRAKPLRIGIAGLGTVGAAVARLLFEHADLLQARCGRPIALTAVSARDRTRDRGVDLSTVAWCDNAVDLAAHDDVDVVAELIGGSDGVAKQLCEAALSAGKPVVTANKALLAEHGTPLARLAEDNGAALAFEAAVAGGIPIIKALREGLIANRITRVTGILNGTCNYILSTMRETGREFADVLAEAQDLGYAEADPSFDIDGVDAAHKLAILAGLAFGARGNFAAVQVEGIRHISAADIDYARQLGYRIKLLGIASLSPDGLEQRVRPTMVPADRPIAKVEGVFNAVMAEGDFVKSVVLEGPGAGAEPTASAVVADICDIAAGRSGPTFGVPATDLVDHPALPPGAHYGSFYVRLSVVDRPGVLADVAACLRDEGVSIESAIQRGYDPEEIVSLVLISHQTRESAILAALDRIAALNTVTEPPRMIRIEAE